MKLKSYRPILIISNSSWYILHYRKLLIQKLLKEKHHVLVISPYDSSSIELSKICIHIPWRIKRIKSKNIFALLISFFRLLFLIRGLKPKLIHSHTLQANLLTSIVSCLFGMQTVISFAGLGRFQNSNLLSKLKIKLIFNLIGFFSNYKRNSRFFFKKSLKRTLFIFQNKSDLNLINNLSRHINKQNSHYICGSGVPEIYIKKSNLEFSKNAWLNNKDNIQISDCSFIFCARLLKSKGILKFIELSKIYPKNKFEIYGSIDSSSNDSLNQEDINFFKKNNPNLIFRKQINNPLIINKSKFPILVVPSNYGEGMPRAILEANALCIPIISSKLVSTKIPKDCFTYVAKNDNVKSYEFAISKIIQDSNSEKLRNQLIKACKNVENLYTEEEIAKSTIKLYSLLLKTDQKSYLLNKDNAKIERWLP